MRKSILTIGAMCLLLGAPAVGGCGGSGDGSTAGTGSATAASGAGQEKGGATSTEEARGLESTSETKAEFVAKANELCERRLKQMQERAKGIFSTSQSGVSEAAVMRRFVGEAIAPGLEAEVEDLRGLGAPEGDEAEVEAIITAIEAEVAKAHQSAKAFLVDKAPVAKTAKLAGKYGIDACGSLS